MKYLILLLLLTSCISEWHIIKVYEMKDDCYNEDAIFHKYVLVEKSVKPPRYIPDIRSIKCTYRLDLYYVSKNSVGCTFKGCIFNKYIFK